MTDRPILFSGPMVRALLDGRKTQTRRPLMLDGDVRGDPYIGGAGNGACALWGDLDGTAYRFPGALGAAVGDRLWVRETWTARMTGGWTIADARSRMFQNELLYAADDDGSIDGWWPSIHMPREFSRLTLAVADVRIQRLQDISEADAVAEGVKPDVFDGSDGWEECTRTDHIGAYRRLWNDLNAKRGYGWDANPWVVALSFTVHHQNIDALGAKEAA